MKRICLLGLLVIVLVSLNWFKVLMAQDLSRLTPQQKAIVEQQYPQMRSGSTTASEYRSLNVFDDGADESCCPPAARNEQQPPPNWLSPPAPCITEDSGLCATVRGDLTPFEELRPFGLDFFSVQEGVDPPVDIASAADYVLGPGDNVLIYLWGRVEQQYNLTIDREGKVFIPTVGELTAWGLSLEKFRELAARRFGKVYSDFELTCSLGKIRSVRVYVTGEVVRPGAYTVSSLTSLFNALCIAGGPNERGSMRAINLMRGGLCRTTVDLYRLLLYGDNSTDVRLESGDVIFVPVAGRRVAIRGEVERSAIYELSGDETAADVLQLAGDATAEAYLERVMLERVADKGAWEVIDVNLVAGPSASKAPLLMKDGDRLTVYSIFEARQNMVGMFGWVKHPGYYERTDTTRVSNLLKQAQLQDYGVYFERADLFRFHRDWRSEIIPIDLARIAAGDPEADLLLQDRDSIHVYSMDSVHWEQRVFIEGAVRKPGAYPLYEGMTAADLIFLAGSYTRDASRDQIELAGIGEDGGVSLRYVPAREGSLRNTSLSEDDHLFVRRLPQWHQERTVSITGQVYYPGQYVLTSDHETLYEIIQRAGGFTPGSFPRGLVLKRPSIAQTLERLRVADLVDRSREVTADSLGMLECQQMFDFDLSNMNRIIIDVDRMIASQGHDGDVVLEPGDDIFVPSIPTGISVMGAVGANGTLGFVPGRKVKDYIRQAGNFTRQAYKNETRLIRAGGEVLSGGEVLGKRAELHLTECSLSCMMEPWIL